MSLTSIDRCFAGSDRHVRCVGNECSSLHDGFFATFNFNFELKNISAKHTKCPVSRMSPYLRKVHQYLCHFVTALSAADVDDDITVRKF